jgi:hypothetical protein
MEAILLGDTELDSVALMVSPVQQLKAMASAEVFARNALSQMILAMQRGASSSGLPGVRDLDSYLTYLNTSLSAKWQALMPPQWRTIAASVPPSPWNVYYEALESEHPNGLRKLEVGSGQSAGITIDAALYAGGFPYVRASGVIGADTVTVTGTALDPATRTLIAAATWTAVVDGDDVFALTPDTAPANSLIAACSGILAGPSLSAGAIVVEAHRPAGRPAL